MKKFVVLALCLVIFTTGAFAMDRAVGGGIMFNSGSTLGQYKESEPGFSYTEDWTLTRTGFGAFAFFGLGRFWEFNLAFMYKNPQTFSYESTYTYMGVTETEKGTETNLDNWLEGTGALQLGVYFKYPIPLSNMFVFFPTGGVDLEISTNTDKGTQGFSWWHDLWIRGGLGLDVFFTEKLFLRTHLIYGAAIPIGGETEMGLRFGHGFLFKAGIGFML